MKKLRIFTALFFLSANAFCFDWPQDEIMSDTFFNYFAHIRGGVVNPSIVFSDSGEVKTSGAGTVTAVLSEHDEEGDLFESTLGNAVIIAHEDSLVSVYANLNSAGQEERYGLSEVETAASLGSCGSSGWQEGNALLEFQMIDLKAKSLVNPRVLLPRFGSELPLFLGNLTAINKKGAEFSFDAARRIPSGTYYIYCAQQPVAMPYKTTIFVNGAVADSITYDTLVSIDGRLCTGGRKNYPSSLVYPDSKRQLAGETAIPKGLNKITVSVSDILGREKTLTYTVEAY
ncbi:MAG: hypothetical protein PUE30_04890 [Spirochaetia bacterium]|nr:hypothetical protein [Spirochaetia bacterium]